MHSNHSTQINTVLHLTGRPDFLKIPFSQKIIKEHHPPLPLLPPQGEKYRTSAAPGQLVEDAHYSNLLNVIFLSEGKKVFFSSSALDI
jgi:hypothetical protein